MKYTIFFLFIGFAAAFGQRDSLTQSKVNKNYTGSLTTAGDNGYFILTWKLNENYYNIKDTFDIYDITVIDYIDSLLAIAVNDSINTAAAVNNFYDAFVTKNNYLAGLKNYITKLYAIRQEND